mmetsp:Transcript_10402/g.43245  ORF Transcript_10402/g.43245 Transcript_10402/m.43245 type:complete len:81 (+) Transcript_10402:1319-1561(+)
MLVLDSLPVIKDLLDVFRAGKVIVMVIAVYVYYISQPDFGHPLVEIASNTRFRFSGPMVGYKTRLVLSTLLDGDVPSVRN